MKYLDEVEESLYDNNFYKEAYSRYDKKRNEDLQNCKHEKWSKQCACCKRILTSETTDWEHIDYNKLQQDYIKLEKIIIDYIIYAR